MIQTIVAALVVAVAAIAGMLFLYRNLDRAETIAGQSIASEWASEFSHQAEVSHLVSQLPHYGRDPKTGRFVKKSALEKLHAQKEREWAEETLRQRTVAVTAGTDIAGPRIETTVVGWGRGNKPA